MGYIGDGDLSVTHLSDGPHRCDTIYEKCPTHRRVFGDLVPIEQYANGGDGRHHRSGNPFGAEVSVNWLRNHRTTTTTETEH